MVSKYDCAALLGRASTGNGVVLVHKPGVLLGGEIAILLDRGFQKFFKTSRLEIAATADRLKAEHRFAEELDEITGEISLYNESLGSVSDEYMYDRVKGRDTDAPAKGLAPWEPPERPAATERSHLILRQFLKVNSMARKLSPFATISAAMCALIVITLASSRPAPSTPHQYATAAANTLAPIPANRAGDSYAIYSLLLPGAPLSTITPEPNQSWSMADTTVNITDMNPAVPPNGELKAPPENVRAFSQVVHDFNTRQYQRFRLDPAASIRAAHWL